MRERAAKKGHYVDPAWKLFKDFLRDMGPRPEGTTLDRLYNPDPVYGPGKCVWKPPAGQNSHKGNINEFTHSNGSVNVLIATAPTPRRAKTWSGGISSPSLSALR